MVFDSTVRFHGEVIPANRARFAGDVRSVRATLFRLRFTLRGLKHSGNMPSSKQPLGILYNVQAYTCTQPYITLTPSAPDPREKIPSIDFLLTSCREAPCTTTAPHNHHHAAPLTQSGHAGKRPAKTHVRIPTCTSMMRPAPAEPFVQHQPSMTTSRSHHSISTRPTHYPTTNTIRGNGI